MIRIDGTRFGLIEVEEQAVIEFPNGLVGFPEEDRFVLLERGEGRLVGYLQSVKTAGLAFPVTDGGMFADYPEPSVEDLARNVDLGVEELAVLVIVAAKPGSQRLDANLLAPIIVDVNKRTGAQVVLDPRKFSAATSLADPVAEAKARMKALQEQSETGEEQAIEAAGVENDLTPAQKVPASASV